MKYFPPMRNTRRVEFNFHLLQTLELIRSRRVSERQRDGFETHKKMNKRKQCVTFPYVIARNTEKSYSDGLLKLLFAAYINVINV